jgi:hypothetical protein
LQILVLPLYFPPLNSLNYSTCGVLQAQGNATAYPKISSLKQTIWQVQSSKVGQYCSETAMHRLCLKEALPLAAAIAIGSVLAHHLKTIFWTLNYETRKLFKIFVKTYFTARCYCTPCTVFILSFISGQISNCF